MLEDDEDDGEEIMVNGEQNCEWMNKSKRYRRWLSRRKRVVSLQVIAQKETFALETFSESIIGHLKF